MTKVITNYTKNADGSSGGSKPYPPSWSMTNNSKLFNATWEKSSAPLNYSFTGNSYSVIESPGVTGDVVIPSTYDDGTNGSYPVTNIGDSAFYWCTSLQSIIIPNSVTIIGDNAFQDCGSLTTISVEENNLSYSSIDGVLYNKNITELITYPASKTNTEFPILNSVTTIGQAAFSGCSGLTSITIPNSVTTIGVNAFAYSGLTSVTISDSVISIASGTFYGCSGLTTVDIPYGVIRIGPSAFQECSNLTTITIPNSVTVIDLNAFYGCSSLTTITIPGSVTSIGFWAFADCPINQVTSDITQEEARTLGWETNAPELFAEGVTWIVEGADVPAGITLVSNLGTENFTTLQDTKVYIFNNKADLTEITMSGKPTEGDTDMNSMFYDCSTLTSLDLSGFNTTNVTTMNQMFSGCTSLTSLDLSGLDTTNVTDMERMFSRCTSLTNIDLTNFNTSNVTTMRWMFSGCRSLTTLDLSKFDTSNVTSMYEMFASRTNSEVLLTIVGLGSLNTSKCTDFAGTFGWGPPIKNILEIANWDVSSGNYFTGMLCSDSPYYNNDDVNTILQAWALPPSNKSDIQNITSQYA